MSPWHQGFVWGVVATGAAYAVGTFVHGFVRGYLRRRRRINNRRLR